MASAREILATTENTKRRYAPNRVTHFDGAAHIECRRGVAIVDSNDYPIAAAFRWGINNAGYASRNVPGGGQILLHRVVMDAKSGDSVDHINGDRLDNRRSNLRIATPSQNSMNKKYSWGKTGYVGAYETKWGAFKATARVYGEFRYFGVFPTAKEAAAARDSGLRAILRPEDVPFAKFNF
jgi:hypothetical protein